jgi:hypothetical protein
VEAQRRGARLAAVLGLLFSAAVLAVIGVWLILRAGPVAAGAAPIILPRRAAEHRSARAVLTALNLILGVLSLAGAVWFVLSAI